MMNRSIEWLHRHDNLIFRLCNRRINNKMIDQMLRVLTHMGGAVFTILFTLSVAVFASEPWRAKGWQSFIALSLSFLITASIKKKMQRIRPYLALEGVNVGKNPLKDPSFPSGHSTAIFSIITPFLFISPWVSFLLIILALIVSISRMYLGLHYPSDCLGGCLVGLTSALIVVYSMNAFHH